MSDTRWGDDIGPDDWTDVERPKERIVAIMGGGDWYDASVEHLVIPSNIDLNAEHRAYMGRPRESDDSSKPPYLSFSAWLIGRGARQTTDDEVLEFWKDSGY